jgi:hypothetical protein
MVGSIYGRSSIKNAHFIPIRYQTWPPQAILVSDLLIFLKSSWWPCLITDRDGMSNLYRGPSIDIRCFLPSFGSFNQAVSEKILKKSANQNRLILAK